MPADTAAGCVWPVGPRQRLPRVVTPFRTETVGSYIDRLARANHLSRGRLQYHVAGDTYRARADWLAAATGIAENILRERLIGFGAANGTNAMQKARVRPACRLCMARRGVYEPVHCWLPAHETVCFRHLRWIGPGATAWEDQHDLSNHPDIVVAARRHRRLIRAHRDLAGNAISEARHILTWWSRVEEDTGDDQTDPATYLQATAVALGGQIILDVFTFGFRDRWHALGPRMALLDAAVLALTAGFLWYCRTLTRRGILR